MSAPSTKEIKTIEKIYNFNHIMGNEYFGQINHWANNWMYLVGDRYNAVNPDTHELIELEFVGCFVLSNDDIETEMDWTRFSDFCPATTIRDLCGFVGDNFEKWKFISGFKLNRPQSIYVFKNLSYKA